METTKNKEILDQIKKLALEYECTEHESNYVENQFDGSEEIPFEGGMSVSEAVIHIKNVMTKK